jgi:hypothetical protein
MVIFVIHNVSITTGKTECQAPIAADSYERAWGRDMLHRSIYPDMAVSPIEQTSLNLRRFICAYG